MKYACFIAFFLVFEGEGLISSSFLNSYYETSHEKTISQRGMIKFGEFHLTNKKQI